MSVPASTGQDGWDIGRLNEARIREIAKELEKRQKALRKAVLEMIATAERRRYYEETRKAYFP